MKSKTKPDIKHSLFNKPFHAYIETHTIFILICRIFLSLISNLRLCFELKRFSVWTFSSWRFFLWSHTCSAMNANFSNADRIMNPVAILYFFFLTIKKQTVIFNYFLFLFSKASRVTQTTEKLRLESQKKLLFPPCGQLLSNSRSSHNVNHLL